MNHNTSWRRRDDTSTSEGGVPHGNLNGCKGHYRARVLAVYEHYAPEMATHAMVDTVMSSYCGRYEKMMKTLEKKYGPEPVSKQGSNVASKHGWLMTDVKSAATTGDEIHNYSDSVGRSSTSGSDPSGGSGYLNRYPLKAPDGSTDLSWAMPSSRVSSPGDTTTSNSVVPSLTRVDSSGHAGSDVATDGPPQQRRQLAAGGDANEDSLLPNKAASSGGMEGSWRATVAGKRLEKEDPAYVREDEDFHRGQAYATFSGVDTTHSQEKVKPTTDLLAVAVSPITSTTPAASMSALSPLEQRKAFCLSALEEATGLTAALQPSTRTSRSATRTGHITRGSDIRSASLPSAPRAEDPTQSSPAPRRPASSHAVSRRSKEEVADVASSRPPVVVRQEKVRGVGCCGASTGSRTASSKSKSASSRMAAPCTKSNTKSQKAGSSKTRGGDVSRSHTGLSIVSSKSHVAAAADSAQVASWTRSVVSEVDSVMPSRPARTSSIVITRDPRTPSTASSTGMEMLPVLPACRRSPSIDTLTESVLGDSLRQQHPVAAISAAATPSRPRSTSRPRPSPAPTTTASTRSSSAASRPLSAPHLRAPSMEHTLSSSTVAYPAEEQQERRSESALVKRHTQQRCSTARAASQGPPPREHQQKVRGVGCFSGWGKSKSTKATKKAAQEGTSTPEMVQASVQTSLLVIPMASSSAPRGAEVSSRVSTPGSPGTRAPSAPRGRSAAVQVGGAGERRRRSRSLVVVEDPIVPRTCTPVCCTPTESSASRKPLEPLAPLSLPTERGTPSRRVASLLSPVRRTSSQRPLRKVLRETNTLTASVTDGSFRG